MSSRPKREKKTKKAKTSGLVTRTAQLLASLDKKESEKTIDEICKNITSLKVTLVGDGSSEPNLSSCSALASEVRTAGEHNFFLQLVTHMGALPTETRRDSVAIYNKLLKYHQVVEYLETLPEVFEKYVQSYEDPNLCLVCSLTLAETNRYENLVSVMLGEKTFFPFFGLIQNTNFDIATNSFGTFKDLLTKHKSVVAKFLEANYEPFFEEYTKLLNSENYVTKRTSLKLLGELLLDRANFHVMTKYISQSSNLKLMLNLLRDPSRNIQFEAFHVFKVFVANPKKPERILDILVRNKDKLIEYLSDFHNDRGEDEQFMEEKTYLIKQIETL